LEGSYYEIGLQMGTRLTTLDVPEAPCETVTLAEECEAILADRFPAILDKVEGMIDGACLNAKDFKALFYLGNASLEAGCTNLAVLPSHSADHSILAGVNYDWYYDAEQWRELRKMAPGGAYRSLRVTHHWAGSPDGLNEKGLGIFLSVLPPHERARPGLVWHLITDLVLDSCQDVDDAWDLIRSVPQLDAFNYLLVDAQGRAAVAEALPAGVTRREASEGFLLATNHLPGREVSPSQLSPAGARRQRKSLARYARATELLRAAGQHVQEETVKALLREHEAPICRGNHHPLPGDTSFDNVFGTIWSLIVRPTTRRMLVAWGHPCGSEYNEYCLT
jgi:predicted choloylglycine hydrolase